MTTSFSSRKSSRFNQLLWLAELCISDDSRLYDVHKSMKRFDVTVSTTSIQLRLPGHKADKFFAGSTLLVLNLARPVCLYSFLLRYLARRNSLFPWHPDLWVRHDGSPPSRSWFTARLRRHFSPDISGHSMRAGGATALAAAGVPDDRIRLLGRWSSEAYQAYICAHPSLLYSRVT